MASQKTGNLIMGATLIVSIAMLALMVWSRLYPDPAKAPTPQMEALMSAYGWGPPIFLGCCLLFTGILQLFLRRKNDSPTASLARTPVRNDEFGWLREIADTQRRSLGDYVRAECWIMDAWLSQEQPFIDFRFVVRSCSVYKVSVVGIGGSISFGYRRLTQPLTVTHNLVQSLSIGRNGYLTITQPLSKEDAAFILNNREQQFCVTDFSLHLESSPHIDESLTLKLDPLVGKTATWEKYPKLKMQIKALGSFISNTQPGAMEPAFITLEVEIENLREGDVQIDMIRLATLVAGRNVVTPAETGDIYQEMSIANGHRYNSRQLKNLATFPLVHFSR